MPPNADQPQRFRWKVQPLDLHDLPDRYRTLYAFSAATLNLATSLWVITSFLCDPDPAACERAVAILGQDLLGPIRPPNRDGVQALRHSMLGTRELFQLSLDANRVRVPSSKPLTRLPRFFLSTGGAKSLSRAKAKAFIVGEIRESAMTLIAGALQLGEQALGLTSQRPDGQAPDPLQGSPEAIGQQLADGNVPDRHAVIAWLGQESNDYRVHFNLSCYFSREILSCGRLTNGRDRLSGETSLAHLRAALRRCPFEARSDLAQQATKDPALVGLRHLDPEGFQHEIQAVEVEWEPAAALDTDLIRDSVKAQVLGTLLSDPDLEGRLSDHLIRMGAPGSRRIPHDDLLQPNNTYAGRLEEAMAQGPAPTDDLDRCMLARLLFLERWTGLPIGSTAKTLSRAEADPTLPLASTEQREE